MARNIHWAGGRGRQGGREGRERVRRGTIGEEGGREGWRGNVPSLTFVPLLVSL